MAPVEPMPRYALKRAPLIDFFRRGFHRCLRTATPSMTHEAPAAMALVMSPEYLMPPSPMMGPVPYWRPRPASMMAVICGTPMPATTRVVQMEPGPMPTFTVSAPAIRSAWLRRWRRFRR